MRLVEVICPTRRLDDLMGLVEQEKADHLRVVRSQDSVAVRIFFSTNARQDFIDGVQALFEGEEDWRLLVFPVEATAPKNESEDASAERERREMAALREEIYDDVRAGTDLNANFFVLTIASTIVAAIGLNASNAAAIIGAMVIAPLLGPILAVTFGVSLGDRKLMLRAGRNAALGLFLGVSAAALFGLAGGVNLESRELMTRAVVGLDSIALALAAGVAAALSVVSGVSSTLVGVMVAVALLPPAAAIGLFAGGGEWTLSARAALLLAVNVVCIMLSSQAVYFWKKVRPRTWLEQRAAESAVRVQVATLILILLAAAAIIALANTEILPR